MRTWIERVSVGPKHTSVTAQLARWKEMKAEGWELTVLIGPGQKSLVAFGWKR